LTTRHDDDLGSAAQLDRFFQLSLDMLCIAGFDGYFKRINPAWERTIGWNADELLARPYLEFVHPEDLDATIAEASKLASEGLDTVSFENRYRCKDGSYKWLLWNATPIPDQDLIFAIARDNTERRQTEVLLAQHADALALSNAQLEDFTYVVSHDLKEPLRAIEAFSSFLAEDYVEKLDNEARRYIAILREAAVRMKNLIEDLLELSRVGREKPNYHQADVGHVLDEVAEELRFALEERGATLTIQTRAADRLRR
jgi:PAS domain S-box-containing protein